MDIHVFRLWKNCVVYVDGHMDMLHKLRKHQKDAKISFQDVQWFFPQVSNPPEIPGRYALLNERFTPVRCWSVPCWPLHPFPKSWNLHCENSFREHTERYGASGGFLKLGDPKLARWLILWKIRWKWMMTGGSPISKDLLMGRTPGNSVCWILSPTILNQITINLVKLHFARARGATLYQCIGAYNMVSWSL